MPEDQEDDQLPEPVLEAEQEGSERPLVTGNPLAKAGIALLAVLVIGVFVAVRPDHAPRVGSSPLPLALRLRALAPTV